MQSISARRLAARVAARQQVVDNFREAVRIAGLHLAAREREHRHGLAGEVAVAIARDRLTDAQHELADAERALNHFIDHNEEKIP